MKYILENPTFVEAPIQITNINAIAEIKRKSVGVEVGDFILVKVDKMFYKLVLREKNQERLKFELTSNIYL